MKAIIIDDNEKARIALKSDIEDYCPNVEIIGEADGVESAYQLLKKSIPEMIFLDIRMGDGTGFDLLEKLKKDGTIPFKIIFSTAYDEFALEAFRYAAVDYLLKPIDSESLMDAVKRIPEANVADSNLQLNKLLERIGKPVASKISLSEFERTHVVDIQEIIRCESHKNYTTFYLMDNRKITVSKTIKEFENLLSENKFLRVHHSHLVNLNLIKEVVKIDGPYLVMKDGSNVPVSTRKKDLLFQRMKEMW